MERPADLRHRHRRQATRHDMRHRDRPPPRCDLGYRHRGRLGRTGSEQHVGRRGRSDPVRRHRRTREVDDQYRRTDGERERAC